MKWSQTLIMQGIHHAGRVYSSANEYVSSIITHYAPSPLQ